LSSRPRLSEKEFYDTLAEINQLCETRKIPCVLMIWPFAGQVAQRQNEALWYQIVTTSAARRLNIPLVNLVPEFIRADGPLFIDHIHANKDGGQIAAAEVYRTIRPLLRDLPE
jgi:lysophospholipase L1-like esterase